MHSSCVEQMEGPAAVRSYDPDSVFLSKTVVSLREVFAHAVGHAFDLSPLPTTARTAAAADQTGMADAHGHDEESVQSGLPFSGGARPYVASAARHASPSSSPVCVSLPERDNDAHMGVHNAGVSSAPQPTPLLLVVPLDSYHFLLSFRDVSVDNDEQTTGDGTAAGFVAVTRHATASIGKLSAASPGCRPPRSGVCVVRRVEGDMRTAQDASSSDKVRREGEGSYDNPYPTLSRVAGNLPFVAFDGWVRDYTVFGLSCHTAVLRQAWEEKIQERQPRGDSPHTSTGGESTSASRADSPPIAADVHSADGVKGAEEERQHHEDGKKNHDDTEAAAGEKSNASASSPECDDEANGDGVGCDDAMYAGTESVIASPSAEPPADTAKALSPSLDRLDCSSTTASSSSSSSVISAGSNTPVPPSPPPPPQQQPQQHEHSQHRDDDDDVVTQAHGNAARTAAAVCVAERSEQERLWSEERRRATAAAAEVRHRFVVADRTQHAIWAIEVSVAQMEVRVVAPAEFYTLNGDEHDGVCDGSRAREGSGGRGRRGDRNSSISSSERQAGSLSRTTTPTTTSQDVATTPQRRRSSHDATAAFPRRRPVTEVTLARHRSGSPSTIHTRHPATRPRSPSPTNPHPSLSSKEANNNNNRSSHGSAPTQTEDAFPPPRHDEEEEVGDGVSGEKTSSRQQQQETPLHGDATVGDASPGHAASVSTCAPRRGRSSTSASPSVALAEAVPTPLMGGARGFVDGHFSVARFNQPGALCWRVDEDDEGTGNEAEDEENSETRERHQGREKESARGLDALHNMPLPQRHCSVLFISDVGNCAIRYANFSNRLVRTIAGMDGVPGYRDGSCVSSLLRGATALAWCSAGLLFTDGANNVVRLITHVQKQTSGVTAKEKQQSQEQKAPAAQLQPGGSASCSAASGGDKDKEKATTGSGVRSQEVEEDEKSADHTRDAAPTTQTAAALVSNSHDSTRSSAELPSQDSVASSSTAAAAAVAAAPAIPRVWTLAGSLHGSDVSITPLHSRATDAKGEGNAAGAGTASDSRATTTTTPANSSSFSCSYIDSNRPNRARFGYLSDLALWVDETGSTQLLVLDQTHHAVRLVEAERGVFTYLGPLDYSTDTFPARKEQDRMMRSSQSSSLPSATALPGGLYYPSSLSMTALVKERSPVLLDAQAGGTVLSPQPFLCSSSPLLYVASGVTGEVSVLLPVSHRSTAVLPADSNRNNNNKSSTSAEAVAENSARALVLERIQSALTLGVATEGRRSIGEATTPSLKRVVWGRNAEDAFAAAKCQDNKNSDENGESEATARLLQRARVAQALPYLRLRFPWLLPPPVPQLSPQLIAGCTCHLSGKRRGSSQAHPQPRPSAGVSGASPPTQAAARRGRAAVSLSPRAARTLSSSRVTRAASSPLASSPPRHPTPPQQLLFSTPPRHPAALATAETPPQHQHAHQRVPGPRGNGGGGGAAAAVAAAAKEVAALLGVRLAAQAVVAAAPRIVEVSDDGESEPSLEAVVVVGTQPTPLAEGEDAAPCERVVASLQPQDLHPSSAHTNSSNSGSSSGGGGGDDGGKAEESHDASAQHSQSHSPTKRNNSSHDHPVVELREDGDGEDAASASPSSGGGPAPAAAESEVMPAETKTGRGGPGKPKWLPPPTKSLSRSPVSTPRRGAVDGDDATTPRTAEATSYAAKFESLSAEQRQQRLLHTLELQQLPQQDISDVGKSGNSSLVDDGSRSPHPIEPQQRSRVDGSPQPQVPSSSSSSGSPSSLSPPSAARRKPLRSSSSSSAAAGAAVSHSPKNSSGRGSPPLTPRAMAAHQLMQRRRTSRSNTAAPHVASVGSTAGAGKAGSREGTSEGHRREDGDRRVPQEVLQPARSITGWGGSSNSNNSGAGERSHSHTVHEVCEGVVMTRRTMGSPAPPSASLAAPLPLSRTAASLHQRYDVAVRRLFTVYSLFATKTVTHAAAVAAPAATTNGTDVGRTVKAAAPWRPSRTVEHYSMSFTAFHRFLILTGYLDYIAGVGRAAAAAALAQESGSSITRQQQLQEHQWSVLLAQVQRHSRASSAAEPAHPVSSSRRHTAAAAGPTGRLSVSTHRTPPSATANASSRHGSLRAGPSASPVAGTPPLVLLPLAVADTRAVADALYSCGVRRQGYHTVACMDFQAFRRAVLLLHTWAETAYSANAKRQQGNTMRGTIDRDGSDGGRCSEDSAAVFAYVDLTPSLDSLSAERVVTAYAAVYVQALRTVPALQPRHPDSPTAPAQSQLAALEGRGSVDEENTRKKKAAAARGRTAGSRFQPVLGFDSRTHSPRSSSGSSSSDTENNANGAARSAAEAPVSPPLSPIAAAKHDVSAVVDEPTQDDRDTEAKAVPSTTRGNDKIVSTTEELEEEDGGVASLPPPPPYLRASLADGERLALDELLRLVQRNETTLRQLFDAYSAPVVVHRSHTYAAPHSAAAAAAVSNPCSLLLGESRSLSNSREVSRVLSEPPSQEPVVRTQTVAKRARLPSSSRHAVSGGASASDDSRPLSAAVSTVQQDTWWKVQQLFTMSSLANKEVFERTSRSVDGMPYKLFVELWRTLDVFPSLMTATAMQQAYVDAVTCVLMRGSGSAATATDVLDTADQPRPAAGAGALTKKPTTGAAVAAAAAREEAARKKLAGARDRELSDLLLHHTALPFPCFIEAFVRVAMTVFSHDVDRLAYPTSAAKTAGLMQWCNKQVSLGLVEQRTRKHLHNTAAAVTSFSGGGGESADAAVAGGGRRSSRVASAMLATRSARSAGTFPDHLHLFQVTAPSVKRESTRNSTS